MDSRKNYAKREIYVNGEYAATTTWARTNAEAIERFERAHPQLNHEISRIRRVTARRAI